MNLQRKILTLVFGVLALFAFQSFSAAPEGAAVGAAPEGSSRGGGPRRGGRNFTPDHPRTLAPYFTPATASPKAPDKDGFLQRWLLLGAD